MECFEAVKGSWDKHLEQQSKDCEERIEPNQNPGNWVSLMNPGPKVQLDTVICLKVTNHRMAQLQASQSQSMPPT